LKILYRIFCGTFKKIVSNQGFVLGQKFPGKPVLICHYIPHFINLKLFNCFVIINANFVMYKNVVFNLLRIKGN